MKKQMLTIILLIVVGMLISAGGCATIMSGSTQRIPVTSIPSGARVTTENNVSITTPGVLILTKKDAHILTARYAGRTKTLTFKRKLSGWLIADVLWDFGIFTIPIDFASGSAWVLHPKAVCFKFDRVADNENLMNCRCSKDYNTVQGKFLKDHYYHYQTRSKMYIVTIGRRRVRLSDNVFHRNFKPCEPWQD